jgi:hypothetical protein
MSTHPAVLTTSVIHLANAVLEDFEREYWAGNHCRSRLAAAPIQAAARHILSTDEPLQPPQAPPPDADSEHQRLYGDALAAWTQLQHCRTRFQDLIRFLHMEIP